MFQFTVTYAVTVRPTWCGSRRNSYSVCLIPAGLPNPTPPPFTLQSSHSHSPSRAPRPESCISHERAARMRPNLSMVFSTESSQSLQEVCTFKLNLARSISRVEPSNDALRASTSAFTTVAEETERDAARRRLVWRSGQECSYEQRGVNTTSIAPDMICPDNRICYGCVLTALGDIGVVELLGYHMLTRMSLDALSMIGLKL